MPEREEVLCGAAADVRQRALVPSYDDVARVAGGRRAAVVAASSVLGVALSLGTGVAAVAGAERGHGNRDRPAAAAAGVALDPSLRRYQTTIAILTWAPDAGADVSAVQVKQEFLTAVFSARGKQDIDYSTIDDLRKVFPDAPVGGPAVVVDQSTTTAQPERAAADLRKVDGVRKAKVVQVTGLWFTVSATGPAPARVHLPRVRPGSSPIVRVIKGGGPGRTATIDIAGLPLRGTAGSVTRDAQGRWFQSVRTTYVGPPITRATFDLIRRRAAEAVHIDVSKAVVTAEKN